MSDSLITKKAIALGLKELTKTKGFDKISISDITKVCGLNRQTFYYHFQDKFELLSWIYYQEAFVYVIEGITLINWDQKILELLSRMKEEQQFYSNTIRHEEEYFKNYIFNITKELFSEAINALDEEHKLTDEDTNFYGEFFSYGICGVIISWVKRGMKENPKEVSTHLKQLAMHSEKLAYERYISENNS